MLPETAEPRTNFPRSVDSPRTVPSSRISTRILLPAVCERMNVWYLCAQVHVTSFGVQTHVTSFCAETRIHARVCSISKTQLYVIHISVIHNCNSTDESLSSKELSCTLVLLMPQNVTRNQVIRISVPCFLLPITTPKNTETNQQQGLFLYTTGTSTVSARTYCKQHPSCLVPRLASCNCQVPKISAIKRIFVRLSESGRNRYTSAYWHHDMLQLWLQKPFSLKNLDTCACVCGAFFVVSQCIRA